MAAIVSREEELASLHAFIGEERGGGPIALVLEGEAGIGKSTHWLAAVEHARTHGLRVLSSRPSLRSANASVLDDDGSSHWTSSTAMRSGCASLRSCNTLRTATASGRRSTGSPDASSMTSATSSARRLGAESRGRALAAATGLLALSAFVAITKASPASGVTTTVLARGTFESFNVRSDPHGSLAGFRAMSQEPIDIVVRRHDYLPHSWTGWHSHPGPVFITVTQGRLTFYEKDDPTCTPHVVSAGQGYVDTGPVTSDGTRPTSPLRM